MVANAATENLFLLEFLVDKVQIDPSAIRQSTMAGLYGESCVQFQFLNNAPLDVCEADFSPKNNYAAEGGTFKSGKSILFSLTPEQAEHAVKDFTIHVYVFKKLLGNAMPDKMPVGETDIQIVDKFNELLKQINDSSSSQPAAKVIKDTYKLIGPADTVMGTISTFIRISCFGKLIVTQFQMNLEDRSVLFKDNQGSSMYRYRKTSKDDKPCLPPNCEDWNDAIHGKKSALPASCQPSYQPSCQPSCPPSPPLGCGGDIPMSPCYLPPSPCCMPPPPPPDDRCYQEIGAEMNGNALTIRVLKDRKKIVTETEEGCCCTQDMNTAGDCCQSNTPGISAIPEGPNPPSLNFKVNNCCNNQGVKVQPPRPVGGFQTTEIKDPHRDVFVLRIGKKTEGTEKKSNLELELRTPKGIDRKPPPKLETRETQYDEHDTGAPITSADPVGGQSANSVKGGAKKGKKGKKGKK